MFLRISVKHRIFFIRGYKSSRMFMSEINFMLFLKYLLGYR